MAEPPAGPGLDLEMGLRHCGGKPTLYLRLLEIFRNDHLSAFDARWTAERLSGDARAVGRLVHTFKGVCLSVGAVSLGRQAEALEAALAAKDPVATDHLAAALLERIPPLQEEVDRALAHRAAPSPGGVRPVLPPEAA